MNNRGSYSTTRVNERERMESNESSTSSSNEAPSTLKRRKVSDDNGYQDEIKSLKLENEELKETVLDQAKTIRELHKQRNGLTKSAGANVELGRLKSAEVQLRLKNNQLEAQIEDCKTEMGEMNDKIIELGNQNEKKDEKIKELEEQLSLAKKIKPDPDSIQDRKTLQDKVNELQSVCEDYAKKTTDLEAQLDLSQGSETFLNKRIAEMEEYNFNQIKLLHAEIDSLKTVIKERDKKIKDMEEIIESKKKNVTDIQFELGKKEKCYKDDLKKNEKLKNEYDKKMEDMKAEMQVKIDNERKKYEDDINRLNSSNEDLFKMINWDAKCILHEQNKIDKLNDKITVAKAVETELSLKNEELKQKELDAREIIIDREKQIQVLKNEQSKPSSSSVQVARFVEFDNLCDGSTICYDRLLNQTTTIVLKTDKLSCNYGGTFNLHSKLANQTLEFTIPECLKNIFRFQVNGELQLYSWLYDDAMQRIHSFNLVRLDLDGTVIKYEDFMKLVSSHTITTFIVGSVKRENDKMLGIDEIFKELPNIKCFEMERCNLFKNDFKKLIQLPTFSNLRQFKLQLVVPSFDLLIFGDFIEKHQNAEFKFDIEKMSLRGRGPFRGKIQKLREILPSKCKVSLLN